MKIRSGSIVAVLTAAAIAVLGVLAFQARSSAPDPSSYRHARPGPSGSPAPGGKGGHSDDGKARAAAPAVPARSGQGKRVVYSLGQKRVWLVRPALAGVPEKASAVFTVAPGTVDPPLGTYAVTSRAENTTGTDGVAIEHVVRFTLVQGVTIGFSAAVDGSSPRNDPARKTGGIREKRADGRAMWDFARPGTSVVVVK